MKVKDAKLHSIIFDETTDINKISQMSLSVRYILKGNVREDFLTFVDCHVENYDDIEVEPVLSGKIIAKTVVKQLMELGLELSYCVGISAVV